MHFILNLTSVHRIDREWNFDLRISDSVLRVAQLKQKKCGVGLEQNVAEDVAISSKQQALQLEII